MDDEPVPMTVNERTIWASLVSVLVSSGVYLTLITTRALNRPVAEIPWAGPMLWTIGLSVAGSVLLATAFSIVSGMLRRGVGAPDGVTSDVRDREIGRVGWRISMIVISAGFGAALVLAMLNAQTFWIGNLLFLFGTAGAVAEAVTKLRLYRRGC